MKAVLSQQRRRKRFLVSLQRLLFTLLLLFPSHQYVVYGNSDNVDNNNDNNSNNDNYFSNNDLVKAVKNNNNLIEDKLRKFVSRTYANALKRQLAIGDFERFNELFNGAELVLPDAELGEGGARLELSDMYCSDVNIGDIQTSYNVIKDSIGRDVLEFDINVSPFAMECYGDYDYYIFVRLGGGEFTVDTMGNSLSTKILIQSPSTFDLEPPVDSSVATCSAKIETNAQVSFRGDFLGRVANLFKEPVSNLIENEAEDAICDEFKILGPDAFGELLNSTKALIDEWLVPTTPEIGDPLYAERNFNNSNGVKLINFRGNDDDDGSGQSIGDLFVSVLKEENAIFGGVQVDENTGETDLGINLFLRNSFLDENGNMNLLLGESETFDPLIFAGHDVLTQTNILIDGVQIQGLDTLQSFTAFDDIGNYTIANEFTWEKLSLEVNLTIDMKPSSLPNSLIRSRNEIQIVENVTLNMDLTGLNVSLALFMAIDEEKFDALKIGSLLQSSNILPCLLSAMEGFEVANLNVSVTDMTVPTMSGFISPGIDRILSDVAEAAFLMFEPTLLRAMPGFFQGPVRDVLKNRVVADFRENTGGCPDPTLPPAGGTLDFRDMFLNATASRSLNGSGTHPYGDIGSLVYDIVQDRFTSIDSNGFAGINKELIRPLTEDQSGTPGLLRFPENIFSLAPETEDRRRRHLAENLFDSLGGFNISIGDIRVTNLDSVVPPIALFGIINSPSILRNEFNMGTDTNRPLSVALKVVSTQDDGVNEVDITASIDSLGLFADVQALIDAKTFLEFPLGDMLDFNCWLYALPPLELDVDGFPVNPAAISSLSLADFRSSLSTLTLTTNCIECPSSGLSLLPNLIQVLEDEGAINTLSLRLPALLDSVVMSETTETMLDRLLANAPKKCPSSPLFEQDAVDPEYGFVGFPTFSGDTIDTFLYSAVLAGEVAFVVFAETERLKGGTVTDPLSRQNSFVPPEGIRLLDWTNIGNTTGFGGIVDQVFGQIREYLGGDDENFLDFEEVLEGFLDEEGILSLETGISYEEGDFSISIETVRITGFDEFALDEVFVPIAPQTLMTSAEFSELNVEFVLVADAPSTPEPPQRLTLQFSVEDLSFDIALFVAFDLDKVEMLGIGSLLDTKTLFGCVMSTAYEFDIPQLKVSIGSFTDPIISGLQPDTQASVSQVTASMFDQYRTQITEAIPILFDGVVKDTIAGLLDTKDESSCKQVDLVPANSFVDFRDLLLPKEEASRRGGSGTEPYGDLLSKAISFLKENIFIEDEGTGLSVINKDFIADLTDSDSPGSLKFPGDVFNEGTRVIAGGLDAFVSVRLYDVYVNNVDSVGVPLVLFDPLNGEPHQLNNSATIGVNEPLEIGARFYFMLRDDGKCVVFVVISLNAVFTNNNTDTTIENELDVSIGLDTLSVLLTAFGKVSERAFLGFPVRGEFISSDYVSLKLTQFF